MKIDRLSPQGPAPLSRKPRTQGGQGGDFASQVAGGAPEEGAGVAGPGSVTAMDALLALQEVPDATAQRSKAKRHGERLLDRLEELRLNLLDGRLSPATIQRLADEVATARAETDDAELNGLLDEIELRARVELAKLGYD